MHKVTTYLEASLNYNKKLILSPIFDIIFVLVCSNRCTNRLSDAPGRDSHLNNLLSDFNLLPKCDDFSRV